jgi:RHS repeat-associated protein
MKYDSHNRLSEYIVTDDRKTRLYYDPMSRVFRKEEYVWDNPDWDINAATHYYYDGGNLVQEFNELIKGAPGRETPVDLIEFDYLRGVAGHVVRRREIDGQTETDKLQVCDFQGSVKQEMDPDVTGASVGTENGYVALAAGEPLPMTQPSDTNHIQFHGGFLEDQNIHTTQGTDGDMGYFYRMGVRHYSPALNRFMQRDSLSYTRQPGASSPLSLNPYIYAMNQPLQMSDPSGYEAGTGGGCPECSKKNNGQGPVQTPGTGTGNTGTGNDGHVCMLRYPEECLEEPVYEICKKCCHPLDKPWWSGCCGSNTIEFALCTNKQTEECACPCCNDPGEENEPSIANSGEYSGSGGGSGGDSITLGPPKFGPDGNGGDPWWFGPIPYQPATPWQIPELGDLPAFSGKESPNSHFFTTRTGITGSKGKTTAIRSALFPFDDILIPALIGGATAFIFCMSEFSPREDQYPDMPYDELCEFQDCVCLVCSVWSAFAGTLAMIAFNAFRFSGNWIAIIAPAAVLGFATYLSYIEMSHCYKEWTSGEI